MIALIFVCIVLVCMLTMFSVIQKFIKNYNKDKNLLPYFIVTWVSVCISCLSMLGLIISLGYVIFK